MRTIIFAVIIMAALTVVVLAQVSGYEIVDVPPAPGMVALGTTFSLNVLNAQTGQFEQRTATVEKYVIWNQPIRPPEYYVTVPGAWFILNRETMGI